MIFKTLVALSSLIMSINIMANDSSSQSSRLHDFEIIAHRGASGFLPEHTKEALVLAYMQGADYIEQDLVATKDHQLVVLHDIHIDTVTNVASVYPDKAREDGRYYAIDFTLEELRKLSINERKNLDGTQVFPNRYQGAGHFTVATFAEQVELIAQLNQKFDKNVGIYTEIKAPLWHEEQNIDITQLFINVLGPLNLLNNQQKMYIQCFEPSTLKRLRKTLGNDVALIQLIAENEWNESDADYEAMLTDDGLADIAIYANGIGPWLPHVYDFTSKQSTGLTQRAHQFGLLIHPYTFREDVIEQEMEAHTAFSELLFLGIDGIFTDQVLPFMLIESPHTDK